MQGNFPSSTGNAVTWTHLSSFVSVQGRLLLTNWVVSSLIELVSNLQMCEVVGWYIHCGRRANTPLTNRFVATFIVYRASIRLNSFQWDNFQANAESRTITEGESLICHPLKCLTPSKALDHLGYGGSKVKLASILILVANAPIGDI